MSKLLIPEHRGQTPCVSYRTALESTKFLPFRLGDFYRSTWVSDAARSVWQSRMRRIGDAWNDIERLAVVEGLRDCCLIISSPKEFLEHGKRWVGRGLIFSPVAIYGVPKDGYSATIVEPKDGQPIQLRFVLGRRESVLSFVEAFGKGNDVAIGEHLGYPECCRQFFQHVWVERSLVDTSWAMALNSESVSQSADCVVIKDVDWRANILWRWMGVRPVFHLPCSFNCPSTIRMGAKLIEIGESHGYKQEMQWLKEILRWPVEWSALHGIAEIKTPILKVSTRTDATAFKIRVQVHGSKYPDEGAQGLSFPYNSENAFTASANYRRGLDNPIVQITPHA